MHLVGTSVVQVGRKTRQQRNMNTNIEHNSSAEPATPSATNEVAKTIEGDGAPPLKVAVVVVAPISEKKPRQRKLPLVSDEKAVSRILDKVQEGKRARLVSLADIRGLLAFAQERAISLDIPHRTLIASTAELNPPAMPHNYKYPADGTQVVIGFTRQGWRLRSISRVSCGTVSGGGSFSMTLTLGAKAIGILSRPLKPHSRGMGFTVIDCIAFTIDRYETANWLTDRYLADMAKTTSVQQRYPEVLRIVMKEILARRATHDTQSVHAEPASKGPS